MKHIAWDRGAVTEEAAAMLAIEFGVFVTQKTIKTQCNKRVKTKDIDNLMADCMECRRIVVEFARNSLESLMQFPAESRNELWHKAVNQMNSDIERYDNGRS